jgi:hypothetical protein
MNGELRRVNEFKGRIGQNGAKPRHQPYMPRQMLAPAKHHPALPIPATLERFAGARR